MRTIWHSLAWKEWHEHKWKLAALTAILSGVSAITLFASTTEGDGVLIALLMLAYVVLPLAMFLGAGTAGEEAGRGTLPYLRNLPASTWRAGVCKLAFGVATCVLSVVAAVTVLLTLLWLLSMRIEALTRALDRASADFPLVVAFDNAWLAWATSAVIYASTAGVSVYLWTVAFGVGSKDEVRAGAWGLLAIVVWWTLVAFVANATSLDERARYPLVVSAVLGASPAGLPVALAVANDTGREVVSVPMAIAVGVVFHTILAAWFVFRFGRAEAASRFSPRANRNEATAAVRFGNPRRRPLTAIAWKQYRESTPIVLAGLAAVVGFLAANLFSQVEFYANQPDRVLDLFTSLTMTIGFLVAIVVGIGVFDRDLGTKYNHFWRSRPIHPDLWFWTKFATGLAVLVIALYLPLFVSHIGFSYAFDPFHPDVSVMLCLQLAVYSSALAMICLIRQPVYAAVLGIGTLMIGLSLVLYFFGAEAIRRENTIIVIESVTAVFATLIAWLAVRRDWGWKNRY